jgi:hypothetical protein
MQQNFTIEKPVEFPQFENWEGLVNVIGQLQELHTAVAYEEKPTKN